MCCSCWAFADAWLADLVDEATKHARSVVSMRYMPPKSTKAVGVQRKAVSKGSHDDNEWQYSPTPGKVKSDSQVSFAPSIPVCNARFEP